MSYTSNPYEAHLQLGILFLDKEDLNKAKMHFKNCLYFKENDVLILAHLTVILVSEGKMHEAKFFLSRILVALQARVDKAGNYILRLDSSCFAYSSFIDIIFII